MTEINPATKLPHTERYLKRQPEAIAAALAHCKAKVATRKRSLAALMRERGYVRVANTGEPAAQWDVA
jgi:hypothetical protein